MHTIDVLRNRGIDLSDEEFAALLDDALGGLANGADDPAHSLTPAEATVLTEGGANLAARAPEEPETRPESAATYGALLAAGLTVAQAAVRLGIDPSRVRHRLADRSLYGIRLRAGWRLPSFQFTEGGDAMPGLDRVLPAIPADLHPLSVWRWLTSPAVDLVLGGVAVSPLEWLTGGGQPEPVAAIAAGL